MIKHIMFSYELWDIFYSSKCCMPGSVNAWLRWKTWHNEKKSFISFHLSHYRVESLLVTNPWSSLSFYFFWFSLFLVQRRAPPIMLLCLLQAHRAPYVLPVCLNPRFGGTMRTGKRWREWARLKWCKTWSHRCPPGWWWEVCLQPPAHPSTSPWPSLSPLFFYHDHKSVQ